MNNKKIKNIIFIVIIILIPLIIMLLNNFSYNDENEKANTCLSGGAQENIYIKLKKGRQNKYNDMIIGSSDVSIMFTANKFNLKVISLGNIGIKNYYEIILIYILN